MDRRRVHSTHVLHVVARLAVLPVLVLALPGAPHLGAVWFGSFALLYGQMFVPTPAGAGAVDVGFLNGASGYVGPDTTELSIVWRFYTTVTGIILDWSSVCPTMAMRCAAGSYDAERSGTHCSMTDDVRRPWRAGHGGRKSPARLAALERTDRDCQRRRIGDRPRRHC